MQTGCSQKHQSNPINNLWGCKKHCFVPSFPSQRAEQNFCCCYLILVRELVVNSNKRLETSLSPCLAPVAEGGRAVEYLKQIQCSASFLRLPTRELIMANSNDADIIANQPASSQDSSSRSDDNSGCYVGFYLYSTRYY